MGQIQDGIMRDWTDGDRVTGDILDQEFKILREAINDNFKRIVAVAPAEYYTTYNNILNHMADTNLHKDWGNYKVGGDGKNDFRAYDKNVLTAFDTALGDKVSLNPNNNFANGIEIRNKFSFPDLPYVYGHRSSVTTAVGLWGVETTSTTLEGGFAKSPDNPYLFILPQTGIYRISFNLYLDALAVNRWGEVIVRVASPTDVPVTDRQVGFVAGTGVATLHYMNGCIELQLNANDRVGFLVRNQDTVNRAMGGYVNITYVG